MIEDTMVEILFLMSALGLVTMAASALLRRRVLRIAVATLPFSSTAALRTLQHLNAAALLGAALALASIVALALLMTVR